LWLKGKYQRDYKFVLAENVARNKAPNSYYFLIDKFNQDLYGDYEPQENLYADINSPITVKPSTHSKWEKIEKLYEYTTMDPQTGRMVKSDRVRREVEVFNIDIEPYHTLIVRRSKPRVPRDPFRPWVGNPVVVGDGSDKSLIRVEKIHNTRKSK
jgi:hypothetical protein